MTHLLHHLLKGGPAIMGVVNVTPDSFSDGGHYCDPNKAADHAFQPIEEGAHILDIGGESTRPGAVIVSPQEEQDRILPVLEKIKGCDALISVDTRNAETMRHAVQAGSQMINDVSALSSEQSIDIIKENKLPICLMHMQKDPMNMQEDPKYDNVVEDIIAFFQKKMEDLGLPLSQLVIDPGIGFGKTLDHNLEILRNIDKFSALGVPILIGTSRKSFIEAVMKRQVPALGIAPQDRIPGSLASVLWALQKGVQIFRVHDVAETRQAFAVYQALSE